MTKLNVAYTTEVLKIKTVRGEKLAVTKTNF